ncbi:MAG: hypothetical protein AAFQ07_14220, partial [Chloroflexota bacterium]
FIGLYILTAIGIAVHIQANALWHFWLGNALVAFLGASIAVGTALVADSVPRDQTDTSIGWFATTPWIGAVIGYMSAGVMVEQIGTMLSFEISTGLLLIAIVFVVALAWQTKRSLQQTSIVAQ